jgi:ABC-type transporter Mla subunit MlaD
MTRGGRWKLGLFVLLGLAVGLGGLAWLGAARFGRGSVSFVTYFNESVQGLEVGSPVKFRGVTVGTVSNITVAPDHRLVEVTADVYLVNLERLGLHRPDRHSPPYAPPDLRVQLATTGITGIKFLLMDYFEGPPPTLSFPPPPNYIPATPSTLKTIELGLTATLDQLPLLTQRSTELLERWKLAADQMDLEGLSRRFVEVLDDAKRKLEALDAKRFSERAFHTLNDAERAVREFRAVVARLDELVQSSRLPETAGAIRAAAESVEGGARELTGVAGEARDLPAALRETLEAVRRLAALLERDPAALLRGRSPVPERRK